ncbi:MAG: phospholipid carrier-dependent glycosyltransferase [Phormidesmis sp. RL_2_1]|nr:phospholipid carrier-dependent glycosyltransferase [Phormidesmis sp. RL_2_1]
MSDTDFRQGYRRWHLGLLVVVLVGIGLRFWQIERFKALVFDEVYFAKFAQAYLAGEPLFDAHPPLGKYFIAAGIWLSQHSPFLSAFEGGMLTPEIGLTPFSYRWMNAWVGSCIPLLVAGIAHGLRWGSIHQRWTFALLAGGFVAIDGLFVTESRYALINIYMVFLGLLGHWLWLQVSLDSQTVPVFKKIVYRFCAAVALGGAIATKWNGLGYLLSLFIWEAWQISKIHHQALLKRKLVSGLVCCLIYGVAIPAITYSLIWWPHLRLTHLHLTGGALASLHVSLFRFHQQLTSSHAACSAWYSWPLLIKPIAYWYEEVGSQAYTVNNMGNPILWWLSSSGMMMLGLEQMIRLKNKLENKLKRKSDVEPMAKPAAKPAAKPENVSWTAADSAADSVSAYLLIGYLANWLPWILVGRCTFIYLYMPAVVFSFMTLAWLLSEWLYASSTRVRAMGLVMLGAIALAFFFWLPLSLGSPLTPERLHLRWWLSSWI